MAKARILLVEDDDTIGSQLQQALHGQGYDAVWVADATQAQAAVRDVEPALILLDLGLPDLDGVELCRRLRAALPQTVIVVLSARVEEVDMVLGLDAGADDYLTKPFRLTELLARLRAHLRRGTSPTMTVSEVGALRLDMGARRCYVDGKPVPLRPKEFDLLALLMAEAGQAVSRERIMSEVWDEFWYGSTKTLDMHVSSLRHKLTEAGENPDRIATLRGFGYRLDTVV